MAIDPAVLKVIREFAEEARELCQKATQAILMLEGSGAAKEYDALARTLHTMKGSAATLGLFAESDLAHQLETLIAPLLAEPRPLPRSAADALLRGLDVFMTGVRSTGEGSPPGSEVFQKALELIAIATAQPAPEPTPAPAAAAPAAAPDAEPTSERGSWRVDSDQVVSLMREVERVREVRLRLEERRREMDRELDRLARGIDVGSSRARLVSISRGLRADGEEAADIVTSLEDGLKAICTLPVRSVLDPLHRAVRDLCRANGKEARLSVVGAEVSLDRRVLEALKGPLVQLVRNSMIHGVEAPEVRDALGKHHEAALVVRVEQAGNLVSIEVADDGSGLDQAKIRAVAIQRELGTPEAIAAMPPHELHELIFEPGFSTSTEVTESSGRGVGLDVVRSQVHGLEGRVEVQSTPGQGTRFVLTIPAELGSSPILLVRCGEHTFGLPMLSVEVGIAARESDLRVANDRMQLAHHNTLQSLHDLGALLGLRMARRPTRGQPIILVQSHGRKLAVVVDEVRGDQELVIRPLPLELRSLPTYQGAATMALGELLLVLSPSWIVEQGHTAARLPAPTQRRALVVDDSLTARAIYRSVLESGGFAVHTVGSANQALDQVQRATYDVLVIDVMLDDSDGIELAQMLRARRETAVVPMILVTARDDDSQRARGLRAGADAFLHKRDCASGRLLGEVAAVMQRRAIT